MSDSKITVGCAGAGTLGAAIMLKDLHMASDVAKRNGAVMPVTSLVEQLHRQLVAIGLGDADNTEFVTLYRDRS